MTIENGGFDLSFLLTGITSGNSVNIQTNMNITTTGSYPTDETVIKIKNTSSVYSVEIYSSGSDILYEGYQTTVVPKFVRIFAHNNFLSIYFEEIWIHTFYFANIDYPEIEDFQISIKSVGASISISDVCLTELYDWREAIYIDFDSVASNAISSVIQQRPIEIDANYLGQVNFRYSADEKRDVVTLNPKLVTEVTKKNSPSSVISDAIVYGNEVEVLTNQDSASKHGFITRIIRIPELDTGQRRAAKELMKKAEQSSIMYDIKIRADLQIEIGDILYIEGTLSGTLEEVSFYCIVESLSISFRDASFSLQITGRSYEAT